MDLQKMEYSVYCLKCKEASVKPIVAKASVSSNNRYYLGSQCGKCSKSQTRFIPKAVAQEINVKFESKE